MADNLTRFGTRCAEAHFERDVVEPRFEHLQQGLAGNALLLLRAVINIAELAFEQPVYAAQLLLFTQLHAVAGQAAVFLPMLTRRVIAALDRAFVGKALVAFEEQFFALAAALPAFCI